MLGHLGGFLTGTIIGLWLLPGLGTDRSEVQHQNSCRKYGIISSITLCITFLVIFYTLREPSDNASSAGSISILDPTSPNEVTTESTGGDEATGETTTTGEDETGATGEGEETGTNDGGEQLA